MLWLMGVWCKSFSNRQEDLAVDVDGHNEFPFQACRIEL